MKKVKPAWYYDEFKHPGVDFSKPEQVKRYDEDHQKIRNYEKEGEAIVGALGLDGTSRVIDMGCGTGAFTCYAAKVCRKVYAVDVSEAMLAFCRQKATRAGLTNVEFQHGGFLSYEHRGQPVDAVVSTVALHHLPDFWKLIALRRVFHMIKPGGKLFLRDVVYSIDADHYAAVMDGMVETLGRHAGPSFAEEAVVTIRDEQGTLNWIMEGLLRQAGFRIDSVRYDGIVASYVCGRETAGEKS